MARTRFASRLPPEVSERLSAFTKRSTDGRHEANEPVALERAAGSCLTSCHTGDQRGLLVRRECSSSSCGAGPTLLPRDRIGAQLELHQVASNEVGQASRIRVPRWTRQLLSNGPRSEGLAEPDPDFRPRWIALRAQMWSAHYPAHLVGAIDVDNSDFPDLVGVGRRTVSWAWYLTQAQLEELEADRSDAPATPITLRLDVRGVVDLGGEVVGVAGDTQIGMPASEWWELLAKLGYATAPSVVRLVRDAVIRDASWRLAEDRLAAARLQLHLGAEEQALAAAWRELERVAGKAYLEPEWAPLLPDMPESKAGKLRKLLASNAGLISHLGRHLDWETDSVGERQPVPVEYWEAELLLAVTQLLLTYALRLRAIRESGPSP